MDQKLFNLIHSFAGKSRLLDFLGIFFADYIGYFLIIIAAALLFSLKSWKEKYYSFALLALSLILSRGILTELIRYFYHRSRPFSVLSFEPLIDGVNQGAFPSGHAAFYFALAGVILFLNTKWGWRFIGAAALMGLARIFVGVHWPLDIAGGALVAVLSAFAAKRILDK